MGKIELPADLPSDESDRFTELPQAEIQERKILPLTARSTPVSSFQSGNKLATGGKLKLATSGNKKQPVKVATSGKKRTPVKVATSGNYSSTPVVEVRQTSRNVCGVFLRYNREPGRPLIQISKLSATQYDNLTANSERYVQFKRATIAFHRQRVLRAGNEA